MLFIIALCYGSNGQQTAQIINRNKQQLKQQTMGKTQTICSGQSIVIETSPSGNYETSFQILNPAPGLPSILLAVLQELNRAQVLHPIWPNDIVRMASYVSEESGELTREANLLDEGKGDIAELKKEAVQTASTSIRMLLKLGGANA